MVTLITKEVEEKDIRDIFGLVYNISNESVIEQIRLFEESREKDEYSKWIMTYTKDKSIHSKPVLLGLREMTIEDIDNYQYNQDCLEYLKFNVGLDRTRELWTRIKYDMYADWSREIIDLIDRLEEEKEMLEKYIKHPENL